MGYSNITQLCFDRRLYIKEISKAEKNKQEMFVQRSLSSDSTVPPEGILDNLTPDDVRQLVVSEDELATSQRFTRIFPTQQTHKYFRSVTGLHLGICGEFGKRLITLFRGFFIGENLINSLRMVINIF